MTKLIIEKNLEVSNASTRLLQRVAYGKINYWSTFIIDFSTVCIFVLYDFIYKEKSLEWGLGALLFGYCIWGLTEYVFHRWIYHEETWVFGMGHQRHHENAQTLLAMPWFMTTSGMALLWIVFVLVLPIPYFSSTLAGWLGGFVFYSLVHHSHHHWTARTPWMRKRKAYHRIHHHFPETNYGVTVLFWDKVFGTRYEKTKPPITNQIDRKLIHQAEESLQLQ